MGFGFLLLYGSQGSNSGHSLGLGASTFTRAMFSAPWGNFLCQEFSAIFTCETNAGLI